jgi:aminoglycoside phosphotransferase (APT) family kinase protein
VTDERPHTSTRDRSELRARIQAWLAGRVDDPEVTELVVPPTNGMSSETVMFDASWWEDGARRTQACVLRLPPDADAVPVFPRYDMQRQYQAIELVARQSTVPVPTTLWLELDPSHLGAPFFVMERVDGVVPPDVMPYPFGDNWLYDAAVEDQAALQRRSVEVLGRLHAIDLDGPDATFLHEPGRAGSALRRHVDDLRAYYEWVAVEGARSRLVDRAFDWLETHWPAAEGPAVLSWGDSRIGNMLYRDFTPVAVVDWEMVSIGPGQIDLGWMIFMHRFFQDLAEQYGLPGMPDFMRCADVADTYAACTGVEPGDLRWYLMYAAVRFGALSARLASRQVRFGEIAEAPDLDDMLLPRATLEAMLDGSWWARL